MVRLLSSGTRPHVRHSWDLPRAGGRTRVTLRVVGPATNENALSSPADRRFALQFVPPVVADEPRPPRHHADGNGRSRAATPAVRLSGRGGPPRVGCHSSPQ